MSVTVRILLASALFFAATANAHAMNEKLKEDAQAINAACKADASTAGCGNEVVGKGLLKCLRNYKQAHKEYKFSQGCRDAMKQLREDRQAEKK